MTHIGEQWRVIPGLSNRYAISTLGRVKRMTFTDSRAALHREKVMSQSAGNGYPAVFITHCGKKHALYVHRLVACAFIPNPLGLPEVNHIDGDKHNSSLSNLEWTDTKGNAAHARRTGLKRQKLSPDDVRAIRAAYRWKQGTNEIAKKYGITKEQVRNVASRRHHQWVE